MVMIMVMMLLVTVVTNKALIDLAPCSFAPPPPPPDKACNQLALVCCEYAERKKTLKGGGANIFLSVTMTVRIIVYRNYNRD